MWNIPSKKRLEKIPKLYETEQILLKKKHIHLHFFIGGCDWYIAEYDGKDLFWGFAVLNNDLQMAEWGYISFSELKSIKVDGWLEVDCELEENWKVRKAAEIDKIRIAQGWKKGGSIMGTENIEEMIDSALLNGILESECMQCGTSLQCEPDATQAWCDNCDKIVKVRNDLIKLGYI